MTVAPDIRIKVGVALDANVETLFAPIEKASKTARKNIVSDVQAINRSISSLNKAAAKVDFSKLVAETEKLKGLPPILGKVAAGFRTVAATMGNMGGASAPFAGMVKQVRELTAELNKLNAASDKAMRGSAGSVKSSLGNPGGSGRGGRGRGGSDDDGLFSRAYFVAGRTLAPVVRSTADTGRRIVSETARGMGVSLDPGDYLQKAMRMETQAAQISNLAYIQKGGPAGSNVRRSPAEILARARVTAKSTSMDPEDVLAAYNKYIGITGDLSTAFAGTDSLAKMAKAYNVPMDQMLSAAGQVARDLPETYSAEQKVGVITQTMRSFVGQSQAGDVEIPDLARRMSKITAQNWKFRMDDRTRKVLEGAGITDDYAQRNAIAGAMVQMARSGGAFSGPNAINAMEAFVRDLGNRQTTKRLDGRQWTKDGDLISPLEAMTLALDEMKGKGPQQVIPKIFGNQNQQKIFQALGKDYKEAISGGATHEVAKEAAIKKFTDKLVQSVSQATVDESFEMVRRSPESSIQGVKNRLLETFQDALPKLAPVIDQFGNALVAAAPSAVQLGISLAKLAPTVAAVAGMLAKLFGSMSPETMLAFYGANKLGGAGLDAVRSLATMRLMSHQVGSSAAAGAAAPGTSATSGATGAGGGLVVGSKVDSVFAGIAIAQLAVQTATIGMAFIKSSLDERDAKRVKANLDLVEGSGKEQALLAKANRGEMFTDEESSFMAERARKYARAYNEGKPNWVDRLMGTGTQGQVYKELGWSQQIDQAIFGNWSRVTGKNGEQMGWQSTADAAVKDSSDAAQSAMAMSKAVADAIAKASVNITVNVKTDKDGTATVDTKTRMGNDN